MNNRNKNDNKAEKDKPVTHLALLGSKYEVGKYYCFGDGLYLKKNKPKRGRWYFRFKSPVLGKKREMGLGIFPILKFSEAREKAYEAKKLTFERKDPIEERRKKELERQKSHGINFEEVANRYIEAKFSEWKGGKNGVTYTKHKRQLALHVFPKIGTRPIAGIDKNDIVKILKPILDAKKGRTAKKLQEYLKSILDYAKVHDWREGDNPAKWQGNLSVLLSDPEKVAPTQHHKALQAEQLPATMKELTKNEGTSALVARFAILNASRSGEARGARWEEIDFQNKLWTIPAQRMKEQKKHIVVLSSQAMKLLEEVKPLTNGKGLIFPNSKGKPLTDNAVLNAIKRASAKAVNEPDATLHGLRATFRTWAGDSTSFEREAIEHALSHVVGGGSERAYSRGVMEEKRRPLMEAWGRFCMGEKE